jgi:hypothetical protein
LTPQPLSPQQVEALNLLRAQGPTTTEAFAATAAFVHTEDQARNLLTRLEKRGHVSGDGRGKTRVWAYVSTPELDTSLGPLEAPAVSSNGSGPETGVRTYVVLERRRLDELVAEILDEADAADLTEDQADALRMFGSVHETVSSPEARNTEHALRIAAKDAYEHLPGEHSPRMVAVADRHFQELVVHVKNSQTVSLGG